VGLVVGAASGVACLPWWLSGARSRTRPVPDAAAAASGLTGPRGRARREQAVAVDVVLVLELVDAAVATGVPLPRALGAVGAAIGGARGETLRRAAAALVLGASWSTAWSSASSASPASSSSSASADGLRVLTDALQPAWTTGSAPGPALRACAEAVRRERRGKVREAAGSLGVRLVLPLGVCFLPAFVLLGIVPVVLSLARGLVS
jgi:pilus assembly protein TadC